jgi:hypothetical protein
MKRKTPMPKSIKELEAEIDNHKAWIAELEKELQRVKSRHVPEPEGWKYIAFEMAGQVTTDKDYELAGIRLNDGRWLVCGNGRVFANWQALVDWLREKPSVSAIRRLVEDTTYGLKAVNLYE